MTLHLTGGEAILAASAISAVAVTVTAAIGFRANTRTAKVSIANTRLALEAEHKARVWAQRRDVYGQIVQWMLAESLQDSDRIAPGMAHDLGYKKMPWLEFRTKVELLASVPVLNAFLAAQIAQMDARAAWAEHVESVEDKREGVTTSEPGERDKPWEVARIHETGSVLAAAREQLFSLMREELGT